MKYKKMTAKEFGYRMAKTLWDSKSSTAFFFIQQAFGEETQWEDCERMIKDVLMEKGRSK
jgi:hypothetical protein